MVTELRNSNPDPSDSKAHTNSIFSIMPNVTCFGDYFNSNVSLAKKFVTILLLDAQSVRALKDHKCLIIKIKIV